jgi:thiamine-phosphate diphosphorylase
VGRTGRDGAGAGTLIIPGRALLAGSLPRLMLVTDRFETRGRDLVDVVESAVAGEVGLVQVRERDLPEAEVEALLRRILERLRGTPARLVVNGHPALAWALDIGLHLPASAPPLAPPRPPLCGRAVHDEAEARQALAEAASYVVVGPVFPTASKPGHPGTGLETLARLARLVAPMPVFAIGGLRPERVASVMRAGAHGVAIRGAILGAPHPERAAREFVEAIYPVGAPAPRVR